MQKSLGNSHQESHQCITNVVKSSATPSGILRMNGFYCSVLITDCRCLLLYRRRLFAIAAFVDPVLMMMVMIMTLDVMKTRRKNLSTFVWHLLTLVTKQVAFKVGSMCSTGPNFHFSGVQGMTPRCEVKLVKDEAGEFSKRNFQTERPDFFFLFQGGGGGSFPQGGNNN